MRRRTFITLLGGAAAAWPVAARAQQSPRVWRIGWLSPNSGPGPSTQAFLQVMRQLGYVEGQNLAIEYRWAASKDEQMAGFATDLVSKRVDLIVTAGTPATLAAKQATSTIPIVFAVAGAPVEKGLVGSLSHPGGNVTGLALITDDIKALQILKEAAPQISRVAFVYDPDTLPGQFGENWLSRALGRSRTLKLDLRPVTLRNPSGTDDLFDALPPGTDALLVGNSATNALARRRICTLAAQRKMPTVSTERAFVDAGCLMSYGEDQRDMFRRAASYVDKILRWDVKPGHGLTRVLSFDSPSGRRDQMTALIGRRQCITLLGGAATAWPFAAWAQDYPSRASTFSAMQATLQYERNPL